MLSNPLGMKTVKSNNTPYYMALHCIVLNCIVWGTGQIPVGMESLSIKFGPLRNRPEAVFTVRDTAHQWLSFTNKTHPPTDVRGGPEIHLNTFINVHVLHRLLNTSGKWITEHIIFEKKWHILTGKICTSRGKGRSYFVTTYEFCQKCARTPADACVVVRAQTDACAHIIYHGLKFTFKKWRGPNYQYVGMCCPSVIVRL